jgi:hypothetical protein
LTVATADAVTEANDNIGCLGGASADRQSRSDRRYAEADVTWA